MVKWLDDKPTERLDGVLILLNVGEQDVLEDSFQEVVSSAYANCMAKGYLLLSVFDSSRGIDPLPYYLGEDEDLTEYCLSGRLGMNQLVFDENFMGQLKNLCSAVYRVYGDRLVQKPNFIVAGQCRIGDCQVCLPPTEFAI